MVEMRVDVTNSKLFLCIVKFYYNSKQIFLLSIQEVKSNQIYLSFFSK